jgi:hypothetical protein
MPFGMADIYSAIDSTKRKVGDALANPVETFKGHVAQRNIDAGEHLGMLDKTFKDAQGRPTLGSDMSPESRRATDQIAGEVLGGVAGATVWHGSPYTFKKFDSANIGAGEGNQAYGHGLYLAENKEVAEAYRRNLTDMNGGPASSDPYGGLISGGRGNTVGQGMESLQQYIEKLERQLAASPQHPHLPAFIRGARKELAQLSDVGSLYKADLADEAIPTMVDWNARMSAQTPVVQRGMERAMNSPRLHRETQSVLSGYRGRDPWAHNVLTHLNIDDNLGKSGAAALLRDEGIAGVKYRDQLSRGAQGESFKSHNFVVYPGNEGLLKILERNGRPIE